MRGLRQGLSALALGCVLFTGLCACSATQETEEPAVVGPDESQLQHTGVQLRQAIQARYEALGRNGGVDRVNGNDITSDVAPYIPPGTPIGQAETILRGAGFSLAQQATAQGEVRAVIDPFMPPLLCRTSVEVLMRPPAPADPRVTQLSARFATQCPAPGHS